MSKVYLVGAGPGDPGLLTLRGRDCLARADVVLYDYLANSALLEHAPPGAELICLGQHGRATLWKQERINAEMVRYVRSGKSVVRLKGGDPAVFARFAEEAGYLAEHGVNFEVVPGITAALATVAYAGVPLTHRQFASSVVLVTGQESLDKQADGLDFAALARLPGTLVFYMGVTTAGRWSQSLIEYGKSPNTPVALIRRCSCPDQRIVRCTLGDVAGQLTPYHKLPPPVVAVVGPVAQFAEPAPWFVDRPLFGQRILVTRAADQIGVLRDRLMSAGADVRSQPAIEISPPADWGPVDHAIDRLGEFDWLVFSSANGVRYFCDRLLKQGRDLRVLAGARVAAIGSGTAGRLLEYHLRADLQPSKYRAESLAESLLADDPTGRFLLLRASRGREVLAKTLTAAGASAEEVIVYQSTNVQQADENIAGDLAAGKFDWVTVTSSAIARALVDLFGESLRQTRLATISPLTSDALREEGFEPTAEATQYNMDGLVAAIENSVAGRY